MGVANFHATPALVQKLRDDFADEIRLLIETDWGDGTIFVHAYSPILPRGFHGTRECVVEVGALRFKRWTDVYMGTPPMEIW